MRAPPVLTTLRLFRSGFHGRHAFAEQPQRFVELDILIDAFDCAGRHTSEAVVGVPSPGSDTAANDVFLHDVERGR